MTINTFQRKCKPGSHVMNMQNKKEGVVQRISKDRDKALVKYEDHSVQWDYYYLLEFKNSPSCER